MFKYQTHKVEKMHYIEYNNYIIKQQTAVELNTVNKRPCFNINSYAFVKRVGYNATIRVNKLLSIKKYST